MKRMLTLFLALMFVCLALSVPAAAEAAGDEMDADLLRDFETDALPTCC